MQRTNIFLEERQTAVLDRIAADGGVSRSVVIRELLDEALFGRGDSTSEDIAAIEASFGVLKDFEPLDRGTTERDRYLQSCWES
jgi:metal-responsive CopG/Arc/MetJ family transcriptional regulator